MLSRVGTPRPDAVLTAERERSLSIGSAGGREVQVVLQPKADVESVATIDAVSLLLSTMHNLERAQAEREERATLWPIEELPTGDGAAVTAGHMRELMSLAKRVANTNVSVLITGESGTGKEVLARAIHAFSDRVQKPFVPFNCTAVPRELLESQLFGYRRGAFTGAERDNPGVIRSARDGTLFLDEIGELGLDLQPKLLRFLESVKSAHSASPRRRPSTSASSQQPTPTSKRLSGTDVFARTSSTASTSFGSRFARCASGVTRSRGSSIIFLGRAAEEFRKGQIRLTDETMERLLLCSWPGNIRQLHNELRRMIALAEPNSTLPPASVSEEILRVTLVPAATVARNGEIAYRAQGKLGPTLNRIEREMIQGALSRSSREG